MNRAEPRSAQFQVIQLTGRLTRNPEVMTLENGSSVCVIRLAVDSMARGGATGYVDVSTFGKPGEAAGRVLSKGWLVAVDGRLDYRHWVTDDGANQSAISIIGNVEFLAAPRNAKTAEQAAG
jgi:single-strand DNA-binding protein